MPEMTVTQKQTLGPLVFKDSKGNLAKVDGVPSWASSDESVVKVNPTADGLSADVVSQGVGVAKVNVNADADLGAGVNTIIGFKDYTINPGTASVIEIPEGPVVEQP